MEASYYSSALVKIHFPQCASIVAWVGTASLLAKTKVCDYEASVLRL